MRKAEHRRDKNHLAVLVVDSEALPPAESFFFLAAIDGDDAERAEGAITELPAVADMDAAQDVFPRDREVVLQERREWIVVWKPDRIALPILPFQLLPVRFLERAHGIPAMIRQPEFRL